MLLQTDSITRTESLAPLYTPSEKFATSRTRWYCLAVVTGVSALQGAIWSNFGPIGEAVKPLYGWHDSQIALLANWGPIMYLVGVGPSSWLLDAKDGLWWSCVLAAVLVLAGSILRCVHVAGDPIGSALMHTAQALNGLAGPVAMSAGPVMSAVWFAPSERTTSTAVVGVSNYGGTALAFVLGPLLVPATPTLRVAGRLRTYMLGEMALSVALVGPVGSSPTPTSAALPSKS